MTARGARGNRPHGTFKAVRCRASRSRRVSAETGRWLQSGRDHGPRRVLDVTRRAMRDESRIADVWWEQHRALRHALSQVALQQGTQCKARAAPRTVAEACAVTFEDLQAASNETVRLETDPAAQRVLRSMRTRAGDPARSAHGVREVAARRLACAGQTFFAGLWSLRSEPPTAVQHRGAGPDAEDATPTHAPSDAAACTHQRHSRRAVVFLRTPFVAHLAATVGVVPLTD